MIRKLLIFLAMSAHLGILAGCNTFEGMGKDVQRGGEHVEDAAKDVKNKM